MHKPVANVLKLVDR